MHLHKEVIVFRLVYLVNLSFFEHLKLFYHCCQLQRGKFRLSNVHCSFSLMALIISLSLVFLLVSTTITLWPRSSASIRHVSNISASRFSRTLALLYLLFSRRRFNIFRSQCVIMQRSTYLFWR